MTEVLNSLRRQTLRQRAAKHKEDKAIKATQEA